jgi:hypothetical protein
MPIKSTVSLARLTSALMAARLAAQRLFRSSFKIQGRTAPPMLAGLQSASKNAKAGCVTVALGYWASRYSLNAMESVWFRLTIRHRARGISVQACS